MFAEVLLSLLGIFFNGSNEDGFEVGGGGGQTGAPNFGHGAIDWTDVLVSRSVVVLSESGREKVAKTDFN